MDLAMGDLVQQAFASGYLSLEAEDHLRKLLRSKYSPDEMKEFMRLQFAVVSGRIRQESRELARRGCSA